VSDLPHASPLARKSPPALLLSALSYARFGLLGGRIVPHSRRAAGSGRNDERNWNFRS